MILGDLHLEDLFNIVAFSEVAHVWQPSGSVPPSAAHLHAAIDYVNQLEAKGCEYQMPSSLPAVGGRWGLGGIDQGGAGSLGSLGGRRRGVRAGGTSCLDTWVPQEGSGTQWD